MPDYKRKQQVAPEDLSQATLSYITEFVGLNATPFVQGQVAGSRFNARIYDVVATQQVVQATTSPTIVYTKQIAGGLLGLQGAFHLLLNGTYLNSSGSASTFNIKITYGATTLWQDSSNSLTSQANRTPLFIYFDLSAAGATNAQTLHGRIERGDRNATPSTGLGSGDTTGADYPIYGSSAVDSTVNQDLVVTVTHSFSSASTSYHMNYALLTKTGD